MTKVTGPISTLPGAAHHLPQGTMCDEHPDRPAVARIQGETDSFGSELIDCCEECRAAIQTATHPGRCNWCKADAKNLRETRDYEEGSCGPVYLVCETCRKKRDQQLEAEMTNRGYYD
jgi:hypothetical protein